jgi:flagellar operon protein
MVDGVGGAPGAAALGRPAAARPRPAPGASGFEHALDRASGARLQFSGHAAKRIEQRGLHLDGERMRRLEAAVERAEAKGARDSVVLLDELALVVSVRNHTVITAMDESSRRDHVFTNIDSVVIAQ